MAFISDITRGIYKDNPVLKQALGLCPTLAVSSSVSNGIGMGLAATFVLICSNVLIAMLRKMVPDKIRIPIYIVVIATFVTIIDLTMAGFVPDLYKRLGIFVPLIVVNCIILGRAEAFAYVNGVGLSIADGLGMGIGYSTVIVLLAFVRELFGTGHIVWFEGTLISLPSGYAPPSLLLLFPGAFLVFAFMIVGARWINERFAARKEAAACRP